MALCCWLPKAVLGSELNLLGGGLCLLPVALGGCAGALVGLVHALLGIGKGLVDGLGGSLCTAPALLCLCASLAGA